MSNQKSLPSYLPLRKREDSSSKRFEYIPKKIFQTWEVNQVSSDMYDAVDTWVSKNPTWEYYFFDVNDRRNFIEHNFSNDILNAYDAILPGAYKADLWRYCVLYIHGGVYADIKIILCNELDKLLDVDTQFTSVKERHGASNLNGAVLNSFICSKPRHPFLKMAIEIIVENVRTSYFGKNALCPTGPFALGRAINNVLNRKGNSKFKLGKQKINKFEFTLWFYSNKYLYSSKPKIATVFIDKSIKIECFHTRYLSYVDEKHEYASKLSDHYDYAKCWKKCKIYSTDVDPRKTLYPTIYQIKKHYRAKEVKAARRLILDMLFKYHQCSWTLIRCYLRYDLTAPIFSFFDGKTGLTR